MLRKFGLPVALIAGLLVAGGAIGCNKDSSSADAGKGSMKKPDPKSLYARLGGRPAIEAVINDFVGRAAGDPAVNFTRKGQPNEWKATDENVALLKKRLVEFVGMATGGPEQYTGKSMALSHRGMNITNAEFDALAGHLKATLDKFNVPAKEQQELITIVAGTRPDIVGK